MLRALDLVDVGPAPRLHLELGSRFNVLTGDNGLGKSFVLDLIWWGLSGTWAGLPAWPREGALVPMIDFGFDAPKNRKPIDVRNIGSGTKRKVTYDTFSNSFDFSLQRWIPKGSLFEGRLPALVFYARADGGIAIWDHARNHPELRRMLRYQGRSDMDAQTEPSSILRPSAYLFTSNEILNGKDLQDRTICNGLIRDWVSWQLMRPETQSGQAFTSLCKALETLSPNPDKEREIIRPGAPLRLFVDDSRMFPTINMGYGDVPIIHASAGIRRIVNLAYLLIWAWHEHIEASRLLKQEPVSDFVFLMDEVETHLHPEWQRRIVPALLAVLSALSPGMKVQIHLTTHAPMVLASLETRFDPEQDKLFVFDLEEGAVVLRETPWARQGDASRWLTSPALNLHRARSVEAERAIDDANAFMRGEAPTHSTTREDIDRALHEALADQDPFWARWVTFAGNSPA